MKRLRVSKNYWTEKRCINIAKKCKNKTELSVKYSRAYNKLKDLGLFDFACEHMKK